MNFEIVKDNLTNGEGGECGYVIVSLKPKGFRSDVIQVTVRRGPGRVGSWGWGLDITTSSGGRDRKSVESDIEAMTYFSEALNHAIEIANGVDFEALETRFQERSPWYGKVL